MPTPLTYASEYFSKCCPIFGNVKKFIHCHIYPFPLIFYNRTSSFIRYLSFRLIYLGLLIKKCGIYHFVQYVQNMRFLLFSLVFIHDLSLWAQLRKLSWHMWSFRLLFYTIFDINLKKYISLFINWLVSTAIEKLYRREWLLRSSLGHFG